MIYIKPSFFDKFRCTASVCTDNCCVGWEIDVDEDTLAVYKQMKGEFGDRVRENLTRSEDGSICFSLCEGERCAFLNKDNLCDIINHCGESGLCDICREHPRFYEWFPGVTECGLGLCCEEVCRLLLCEGFTLVAEGDGEELNVEDKQDIIESDKYIFISAFREALFDVLFSDASLEEKLDKIMSHTEKMTGRSLVLPRSEELVDSYMDTEPIDDSWTQHMKSIKEDLGKIREFKMDFFEINNNEYSRILAYILYRHLIKSVFDDAVYERVLFCLNALKMIMIFDVKSYMDDGVITLRHRIDNLKRWSKQIEYSEDNTDYLIFGSDGNGKEA
ncbi:MAG: flagellin lysine-N-methylase [Clostridia bacterium]|nr:flagellin lysine-N-methylase [Clostridia bacterium]